MDEITRNEIIEKAKIWMRDSLIESHRRNTEKLVDIDELNINPFLLPYLGNFLEGNTNPETLAKVLLYPRILGTSIATSFGTQMQRFITTVLDGFGSTTEGIDIEFIDYLDNRRKYAQLKSGPNAINKDDVTTIKTHFKSLINRARTNNLSIQHGDLVFCLLYGEEREKNTFIQSLEEDYTVYMGQVFWTRFTGDETFYRRLSSAMAEVANDVDMKHVVESVIKELAPKVEQRFNEIYGS